MFRWMVGIWACAMGLAVSGCSQSIDYSAKNAWHEAPTVRTAAADKADEAPRANPPRPAEIVLADNTQQNPAQAQRVMVYTAAVRMVVLDRDSAQSSIQAEAERLGGFMQSLEDAAITIKVPAQNFSKALDTLENIGQVRSRQVKGRDVTEQYRDLKVRVANAEKTRQRLVALLDKAQKVSETLEIEKELHRITEELERLQGKLRYLAESVAFSTITVHLNAPVQHRELVEVVPFRWVRSLGTGFSQRPTNAADRTGFLNWGLGCTLPEAYVSYYQDADQTQAMSADQIQINLRRHKNYRGGDLIFWSKLARRSLADGQSVVLDKKNQSVQVGGREATVITGRKKIGKKHFGYMIGLVRTDSSVYSFEAWGPKDVFDDDKAKLIKSFQSLKPSLW